MMKKKSWVCTLITQISICFALYCVFRIGQPQNPILRSSKSEKRPLDMYFISVVGGFRPIKEQTLLLKQMKAAMEMYDVKFVIDISELGGEDPLFKNATSYFQSLEVPWYVTRSLKGQGADYYHKSAVMPFGRTLDVIGINTGLFEDPASVSKNEQLHWLERTLRNSRSDWCIVIGFHSLINCTTNSEELGESAMEPVHHILLKYGVNAYLSRQACPANLPKDDAGPFNSKVDKREEPYLTSVKQRLLQLRENEHGFVLHGISSLEFVSYFVSLEGEFVHRIAVSPRGREFM